MDIKEAREEITNIDKKMAELFVRRMECAAYIADYKRERGLPIEDLSREQYLLDKMSELVEDDVMRSFYVSYQKGVMDVSKRWQHRLNEGQKIAFCGRQADDGTDAAERIAPEANIVAFSKYEEAYNAVVSGECDLCILPMENGCGGEVGRVMDLIYSGNLYINSIYEDDEVMQKRDDSRTGRYAVLSRVENQFADKENGAFLLMFTVNDETGSLAKAINMISAYDYNMRIMRSRPMRDLPWHYYFYAEAVGDDTGENGRRMLNALRVVCPVVKVAGRYSLSDRLPAGEE